MAARLRYLTPARLRALLPDSVRGLRHRLLFRLADALGYDLVRRGFYSPLPSTAELPPDVWTRRSPLEGIEFDGSRQLSFVTEQLASFIAEFDPEFDTGTSLGSYNIRNLAYDEVDSEILYGLVRYLKPTRVVELGSGFSSLVLERACEVNRGQGNPVAYDVFDPFPQPWIREGSTRGFQLHAVPAQDVDIDIFDRLQPNDILFVDTTHTVKIGSEVNRIVLDVLPRLARGVVVHFHDIFLPWEYHRHWIEGDWKWNEQYLLQALLSMNDGYEVVVSAQALARDHHESLKEIIPTLRPLSAPSAFWIRRR